MLAKVNPKTACGCTKRFFQNVERVLPEICVPVRAAVTDVDTEGYVQAPSTGIFLKRIFRFVHLETRSSRRLELRYEEVMHG